MQSQRQAIIQLHCAGKANSDIARYLSIGRGTVWKTVNRFKERGDDLDRARKGRPRSQRTRKNINAVREKIRRNPKRSMRRMAAETGMSATTMRELVHKDLGMSSFKMERRHFFTDAQKEKRLRRSKILLNELRRDTDAHEVVFSDEKLFSIEACFNRKNDLVIGRTSKDVPKNARVIARRQKPASVMVWAGVSKTWKSPLFFIPMGVKVNAQLYINDILVPMANAAKQHFKERVWTFQQDGATSHTANITQTWCKKHLPQFWTKDFWPPSSPDLSPLDYSLWSILEARACAKSHTNINALKLSLQKAWTEIPQETVRAAIEAFPKRLRAVIAAKGDYIE